MAEVVRGGLQAMPKGQYEGAMSLGLGYWKMMVFIILPQALRIVIPGIVNTFIGLFKDTTLVSIVGIFDFVQHDRGLARRPELGGADRQHHRLRLRGDLLLHRSASACRATPWRSSAGSPPARNGDAHGDRRCLPRTPRRASTRRRSPPSR